MRNLALAMALAAAGGCRRREPTPETFSVAPEPSVVAMKDAESPDLGETTVIGDGRRLRAAASGDKLPCVATDSLYVRVGNRVDRFGHAEGHTHFVLPAAFADAREWTARGDSIVWVENGFARTWSVAAGSEVRDASTVAMDEPPNEPTIHDRALATRAKAMFCFGPKYTAPCAQLHGLSVVPLDDRSPLPVDFAGGPPYGYVESVSRSGPFVAVFGEGAGKTLVSIDPRNAKVRRIATVASDGGERGLGLAASDHVAYFIASGALHAHPITKARGVARLVYDPGAHGRVAAVFANDSTVLVAVAREGEPDRLVEVNGVSGAIVRTLRTEGRVIAAHGYAGAAWWCTERGAYAVP